MEYQSLVDEAATTYESTYNCKTVDLMTIRWEQFIKQVKNISERFNVRYEDVMVDCAESYKNHYGWKRDEEVEATKHKKKRERRSFNGSEENPCG